MNERTTNDPMNAHSKQKKRKKPILIVLIVILIVGLLAGGVFLVWYFSPEQKEKRELEELEAQERFYRRIAEPYGYDGANNGLSDYQQELYDSYRSILKNGY